MNRRAFVTGLGAVLATPLAAGAQSAEKVWRVGFFGPPPSAGGLVQAFQQGLRELGYVEGRNIKIEYRYTDVAFAGGVKRFAQFAAELIELEPNVLVVSINDAAVAAKKATATIPIVMVNVGNPVESGLIQSLAHPGGNITGLCWGPGLTGKTLEILKQTLPAPLHVAALMNRTNPLSWTQRRAVEEAATSLHLELKIVDVGAPTDLDQAFAAMVKEHVNALLVVVDAMFYLNRTRIAELALRNRFPSMFPAVEFATAGGLLAYAPSSVDNYHRAAIYVDKILKGSKPADLPVEQPSKFEFVINLKTAKALGLTIPQSLLMRADQIIE